MTTLTARSFSPVRSIAAIALASASLGLSGCYYIAGAQVPGVPLEELDMAGAAPYELSVAGPDDVIVTVGKTLNIAVDGDSEGLKFDLTETRLGIARESDWEGSNTATIRVTMPAPRDISIAGSGDVDAAELASDAEISIAGSGNITVATIAAKRLDVSLAGNGGMTGAGSADRLEISIAGSGDVDFAKLKADRVEVSIAGSGDVSLMSDGEVDASIAGSGNIDVVGTAKCDVSAMGSGTLNCAPAAPAAPAAQAEPSED